MATYNGARFLADQLGSIAIQTQSPVELVICDDGSTDSTPDIVGTFAASAPFPVHFHPNPERLGYARNFGRAASLCRGEVIAFCDQDDWWEPLKLQKASAPFVDPQVQLVYHNARIVDGNRVPGDLLYSGEQEQAALSIEPLAPWHHSYGLVQLFRSSLRQHDDLWRGASTISS